MKIFLSWHGARSRLIAEALHDWLPRVIQAAKPFFSPEMEKGTKWSTEIDSALEGTRFGIICLTPDNLESTWIHYETGALSKTADAIIWTFLQGLKHKDVPQPLGKFHHTLAEKDDVFRLVTSINGRLAEVGGESLLAPLLRDNFETYWPRLEDKLKEAETVSVNDDDSEQGVARESSRGDPDILGEILELARNQERRLSTIEGRFVGPSPSPSASPSAPPPYRNDFYKEITLHLTVEEPNVLALVEGFSNGFQQSIPGTMIGLTNVTESQVRLAIKFPYPVDEDFVDDVLHKLTRDLGVKMGGYSSNPAW